MVINPSHKREKPDRYGQVFRLERGRALSLRGWDEGAIFVGRSARGRDVGKIEKAPLYPLLTDEGTRNNHLFSLFSRGGMWIATLCSQ